ncbi:MAG: IPT/TIG domain-containing protein [Anaeromyxobacter sp.]|nr:IPT/TIG domain-containing protein [Anaeromyxobacter sp.]MBL0276309.1 IPT/TIG domain-containing protein [Anaeromyxobacter sp.]
MPTRRAAPARRTCPGPHLAALLAATLATACGGGGGASYSLSATPEALAFQVVEGDPPEGVQVLTVDFKGDGLLVGYPPGVEVPTWLQAPGSLTSSSRALIYVQVSAAGLARGSYATTLRLVTGKEDGSEFVVKDVPVTLQVRQGLVVGPEALDFTALEGFAPAAQALTLGSDLATERWSVAARGPAGQPADWVVLPVAGGSLSAGAGQVQVGVAPRTAGDHLATLVVRDEAGSVRAEVPLRYHVDALVAASAPVSFRLDGASGPAALARVIALQSRLPGAAGGAFAFTLTPSAPWLSVSPAGGDLSADTQVTVTLDPALSAALPDGRHEATLEVAFAPGLATGLAVPVTLDVALPAVEAVSPSTSWVGRAGEVVLTGHGFGGGATLAVAFGGQQVEGRVVSDTVVRATAPAQAAPGPVQVKAVNGLGMSRGGASLAVLPAPGYTTLHQALPATFYRMAQDPARRAVLLTGYATDLVYRLAFEGGAWAVTSRAVPNATNVVVSQDGARLLVTSGYTSTSDAFFELDPISLATLSQSTLDDFYGQHDLLCGLADGRTLLVDSDQWAESFWYPSLAQGPSLSIHGARALVTRDRSRVVLASTTSAAGAYLTLDVGEATPRSHTLPIWPFSGAGWSISGDGARLLVQGSLFDRDLGALGDLSAPEFTAGQALSPDGAWAYTVGQAAQGGPWVFRRTRVDGAGPYVAEATPLALSLPADQYPVAMEVSEDGSALFLLAGFPSGPAGSVLHVLPLP